MSSKRKVIEQLIQEFITIYSILYENNYIIEHRNLSCKCTGDECYDLTWSGRSSEANITFDTNLEITPIVNTLLKEEQFSLLFYDKSILQVEYKLEKNQIIKQRLQFIKKSSYIRSIDEICKLEGEVTEVEGGGWFEEETGIPIFLRVDYDPVNHRDIEHAKSHFVISNIKDCRIPMKKNLSLTKFVELILHQVYNDYEMDLKEIVEHPVEITDNEQLVMHLNW